MNRWKRDTSALAYSMGKRALAAHDAVVALRLLRTAVDGCSANRRAVLARRLYWLSIALRKLGKDGLAVKALSSAQRLSPRGQARDAYKHFANEYGMPKASCSEHDDYRAFCSIQVRRYLERVPDHRFSYQAEIDTVLTSIADAWLRLQDSPAYRHDSCDDKLKTYREVVIDFPALRTSGGIKRGRTIAADFFQGRAIKPDDRCACGSGLPYRMCCGRTRLPYETEIG